MINYTISRLEAIRNKESNLITDLILGITATDDEDGTPLATEIAHWQSVKDLYPKP